MTGLLLTLIGFCGVVWFTFLSWRALGGATANVTGHDIANRGPVTYRWIGRAFALMFIVGVVKFFLS